MSFRDFVELNSLVDPKPVTGGAVLAAGAEQIFVYAGSGAEGVLIGFDFYSESEDYQTSPIRLCRVGASAIAANSAVLSDDVVQIYTVPVSRGNGPFYFPSGLGVKIRTGQAIALQVKNNESVPIYFEGTLVIATWTRNAITAITQGSPALDGGVNADNNPLRGAFC